MDKDIKDLQSLWHQQKTDSNDSKEIIDKLNDLEKKDKRDRALVLSIFPLTIIPLVFFIPILESPYYLASIIILVLAMLMIIFLVFRNKFETIKDEKEVSNKAFINAQIGKLKEKKKITSFYMWIYCFLIILGVNVAYVEAFSSLDVMFRLLIHFPVTILLFLFMYWLVKRKEVKNEEEIEPLIQQLESLKMD